MIIYNPKYGKLNDFKNFLFLALAFLGKEAGWTDSTPTETQYEIADELQDFTNDRQIIMAFRGTGKTVVAAIYVVWLLMLDPTLNIEIVSKSNDFAKQVSFLIKRMIENWSLVRHLKPGSGQRDNVEIFDVGPAPISKDPSVKSVGITGQITGSRADVIIADDVEVPGNSYTVDARGKLILLTDEFGRIIKPKSNKPFNKIVYLGTPQTEQSIYFEREKLGYTVKIWPIMYPENLDVYNGRLHPRIYKGSLSPSNIGKPTDRRFPMSEIVKKQGEEGYTGFQLQYMLNPDLSDEERYPLKLANLIVMSVNDEQAPVAMQWGKGKELELQGYQLLGLNNDRYYKPFFVSDTWKPYDRKVMAIDPSGAGKDSTGYCIGYVLEGMVFFKKWSYIPGGYGEDARKIIRDLIALHKVDTLVVEENGLGAPIIEILKMDFNTFGLGVAIQGVKVKGEKYGRICDILEPWTCAHRIVLDEAIITNDIKQPEGQRALVQFTRMQRIANCLAHEDIVDAASLLLAYIKSQIHAPVISTEEEFQEKLREQSLLEFEKMFDLYGTSTGNTQPSIFNLKDMIFRK